ncbi:DUF1573 domain-containing protein [Flavobacterium sangjuense]|uniref:DUF1573 domain-containing protein n=1 Tax=Flavobacterium sangjuense TaxID=2518177 RepID=A0A4P7PVR8_9FLAO|nr:DUF1573 domain-containing protein [Flavobacterium sangjuense]QBZ99088.1 hypothetical protein GS03_02610 [Flavobacterium sangjuense]
MMTRKFNLLLVVGLLIIATACKNEDTKKIPTIRTTDNVNLSNPSKSVPANGKYPIMSFDQEEHDFGTIQQGDNAVYDFSFKNTGEADLIITSARGSCGCTVPDYPKTPIKVGESGKIHVWFTSAGKHGETSKTVTIICNTKEENKILTIKANIEVPKKG